MVAGLQHDSTLMKQKLRELERSVSVSASFLTATYRLIGLQNLALRNVLKGTTGSPASCEISVSAERRPY